MMLGLAARHPPARDREDRPHHPRRPRSRRASSRTGRARRTSSPARTSISIDFPVPQWNRVDGGRYILTYGGVVTKDPTTGVMNVGVYRGMVSAKDRIPILMWRAQHIGHHVTAWQNGGSSEMPIAVAIGWEPSLAFTGGSPVPKGVCEYDVMGSIRGEPVDLVKCETVDLYVPATAEIVIEGYLQLDPEELGHGRPVRRVHRLRRRRQEPEADHPRHRHHPPQQPDPARRDRGLAARLVSRRTASARRSCAPRPPGTCSTAPACPASPTCGARRCRPASIC